MASFVLARFTFGAVRCAGWYRPTDGARVGLRVESGDLVVSARFDAETDTVSYTWPRGVPDSVASARAVRHFERKTGATL